MICPYCRVDSWDSHRIESRVEAHDEAHELFRMGDLYVHPNGMLISMLDKKNFSFHPINYCPMCGRKFKQEGAYR